MQAPHRGTDGPRLQLPRQKRSGQPFPEAPGPPELLLPPAETRRGSPASASLCVRLLERASELPALRPPARGQSSLSSTTSYPGTPLPGTGPQGWGAWCGDGRGVGALSLQGGPLPLRCPFRHSPPLCGLESACLPSLPLLPASTGLFSESLVLVTVDLVFRGIPRLTVV